MSDLSPELNCKAHFYFGKMRYINTMTITLLHKSHNSGTSEEGGGGGEEEGGGLIKVVLQKCSQQC